MSDLRDRLGDHAFRYYDLWHTIKNNWINFIFILVGILIVFFTILFFAPKEKIYDCSLAEISPDYPIEVKEACRKIRARPLTL